MLGLCVAATLVALAVLAWIFGYVLIQGARYVNLGFFTNLPAPVGEPNGGFLNALVGTVIMVGVRRSSRSRRGLRRDLPGRVRHRVASRKPCAS